MSPRIAGVRCEPYRKRRTTLRKSYSNSVGLGACPLVDTSCNNPCRVEKPAASLYQRGPRGFSADPRRLDTIVVALEHAEPLLSPGSRQVHDIHFLGDTNVDDNKMWPCGTTRTAPKESNVNSRSCQPSQICLWPLGVIHTLSERGPPLLGVETTWLESLESGRFIHLGL